MTTREAIKVIKRRNKECHEADRLAIYALRKLTPLKPNETDGEYLCPSCGLVVTYSERFCENCWQKLDWRRVK